VPEYVVIDPKMRQLRLYRLNNAGHYDALLIYNEADKVTLAVLPMLSFMVGDLFAGAPDPTI
jgi:Uma2 family endonuclease